MSLPAPSAGKPGQHLPRNWRFTRNSKSRNSSIFLEPRSWSYLKHIVCSTFSTCEWEKANVRWTPEIIDGGPRSYLLMPFLKINPSHWFNTMIYYSYWVRPSLIPLFINQTNAVIQYLGPKENRVAARWSDQTFLQSTTIPFEAVLCICNCSMWALYDMMSYHPHNHIPLFDCRVHVVNVERVSL